MSKKRLEEIKKRLALLHSAVDVDDEYKNYIFKDLKVEWLIEQAERVQSLEYYKKDWMLVAEQNKRYREALEFYACGNHYSDKLYDDKIILLDDGEIARKALEESK